MNISKIDALVRLVLGVLLIDVGVLQFYFWGMGALLMCVLGIGLLLTALLRRCPLYSLFGISSGGQADGKAFHPGA